MTIEDIQKAAEEYVRNKNWNLRVTEHAIKDYIAGAYMMQDKVNKWKEIYQIADKMAQKSLCILAVYDVQVPTETISELQGMEDAIKVLKQQLP